MVATGSEVELASNVTAPFCAKALPNMDAPVLRVIEVKARMVPLKTEPVLRVADEPTCQKTLAALALFVRTMLLLTSVMSVEPA